MRNIKYVKSRLVGRDGEKLTGRGNSYGINGRMVDATS
jgi:hypothetical protein